MTEKQTDIKVHSQRMLALNDELNQITEKLFEGKYKYDRDGDFLLAECTDMYPSFSWLGDCLGPLNYPGLSNEKEYSIVNADMLWDDYIDICHYGNSLKCKELAAFGDNLLSFIKEEAPNYMSDLHHEYTQQSSLQKNE